MEPFSLIGYISHNFFIKYNNQGQLWNPQEKLVLNLSLVVIFDKEMMEILTVKEKASVYELTTFIFCQVYGDNSSYTRLRSLVSSSSCLSM